MDDFDAIDGVESWRNTTNAIQQIKHRGENKGGRPAMIPELINPGRVFTISPSDRRALQNAVFSETVDPFKDGTFAPVALIETEKDVEAITGNPNQLTETEIAALLKGAQPALDARLEEITNPVVVRRMLAVADAGETSVKKVKALRARLAEIDPTARFSASKTHRVGNVNDLPGDPELHKSMGTGTVTAARR